MLTPCWASNSQESNGRFSVLFSKMCRNPVPFCNHCWHAWLRQQLPELMTGSKFPLSKFPASSSSLWGQPGCLSSHHKRGPGDMGCLPGLTRGEGAGPEGSSGVTPNPALARGQAGSPGSSRAAAQSQAPAAQHVPATEARHRHWQGAGCPAQREPLFSSDYRRYLLTATFPTSQRELEVWTPTREGNAR